MERVDALNLPRLKAIIQQNGWPTIKLAGTQGANAAWLLAQHADADRDFQMSVLALMEPLVKSGQASAKHVAYLYDRTHTPQRYGTQGACTDHGGWAPRETEDPEHVDQRRAELGLPSMAEYIAQFTKFGLCPAATSVTHGLIAARSPA
jgi:hypothetical protein